MQRLWLIAILMVCGCGGPERRPTGEDSTPVKTVDHTEFADAGLEEAVRRNTGKLHGPLEEGLAEIEELQAGGLGIADLEGIGRLAGLRRLFLGGNRITEIGPLSGVVRLEVLDLADNQVRDLAPLARLTRLTHLNLDGN